MANVSFHIGSSAPGTSGLTTGGLYVNTNGGLYYASSATAKSEIATKVSLSASSNSGYKAATCSVNGAEQDIYIPTWFNYSSGYSMSSITGSSVGNPPFVVVKLSGLELKNATAGVVSGLSDYVGGTIFMTRAKGTETGASGSVNQLYTGQLVTFTNYGLYVANVRWNSTGWTVYYQFLYSTIACQNSSNSGNFAGFNKFASGTFSNTSTYSTAWNNAAKFYDYKKA